MKIIDNIPTWGEPLANAVEQMKHALRTADRAALMADHHLGYAVPVGGVIAYREAVSPSGVGYDIACGNKAVRTNLTVADLPPMSHIMDEVVKHVSFGIGHVNADPVEHALFDDPAWNIPAVAPLKDLARRQLGTVGSGNHYVDIFKDEGGCIWVGTHFGSRGLGHKIATHYIREGGGRDGVNVDPVVFPIISELGQEYLGAMNLAGRYAYAGRDWVCDRVVKILGGRVTEAIHNHHNFAWDETHDGQRLYVVRKGATPAFPGQLGFVGGTMGEDSVILEGSLAGNEEQKLALFSTVHGAGRIMSRTQAAGKVRWIKGVRTRITEGAVSPAMMDEWVRGRARVELRGGGCDESPHAYKRLADVLAAHSASVNILHRLTPLGVAMAGEAEIDPYKD